MIKIANAPCSWGVLEFGLEGQTAGYAQVLDEMHETGYAGTELGDWGFMPTDPEQLKRELRARDLEMLGAFVPVNFSDSAAHADGEATAGVVIERVGNGVGRGVGIRGEGGDADGGTVGGILVDGVDGRIGVGHCPDVELIDIRNRDGKRDRRE